MYTCIYANVNQIMIATYMYSVPCLSQSAMLITNAYESNFWPNRVNL